MKLPRGYGSVYKLSGKRNFPWTARKTLGFKENGQPNYLFIGFYRTRSEALQALSDYNHDPFSTKAAKTSLTAVYEVWRQSNADVADKYQYLAAWRTLEPLHSAGIGTLSAASIQNALDRTDQMYKQKHAKALLRYLFDYAIREELIKPERLQALKYVTLTGGTTATHKHRSYTNDEVRQIWKAYKAGVQFAEIPVIIFYTGLRISELLNLNEDAINTKEWTIHIESAKTASGVRTVPVADIIKPVIRKLIKSKKRYLFEVSGGHRLSYQHFRHTYWPRINDGLSDHLTHDMRHTFATALAVAHIDTRTVNALMGHRGSTLAENVYTHIPMDELRQAVNAIKY